MIEKNHPYAILNIVDDKIQVLKPDPGKLEYSFILKSDLKNVYSSNESYTSKVFSSNWFKNMHKNYINWIRFTFQRDFIFNYILISNSSIEFPHSVWLNINDILQYPFAKECYPLLFGVLSRQLPLEQSRRKDWGIIRTTEKKENLDYNLWLLKISEGIASFSYTDAIRIIKISTLNSHPYKAHLPQELITQAKQIITSIHDQYELIIQKYNQIHIQHNIDDSIAIQITPYQHQKIIELLKKHHILQEIQNILNE